MSQYTAENSLHFDVVIVGAGPAGLSAAIRLKQLAQKFKKAVSVVVVEKGSRVGAHLISGAVMDPKALTELLPDWQKLGAPLTCKVKEDCLLWLTARNAIRLPTPPSLNNQGNYIISLEQLCQWLAQQAELLGVEIYPGFAAVEVLYHTDGSIRGIKTGEMGVNAEGLATKNYQEGINLLAQQVIFAEGSRGNLTQQLLHKLALDEGAAPQTYALGLKEIWEVNSAHYREGSVLHTVGWPLDGKTYGGSFIYHLPDNKVSLGYVVGLDYRNPYLSPFEEFQRYKQHPMVRGILSGGRRIAYGARSLTEGGVQSLPQLSFPGGVLVGDAAGFLNVPRMKGTHAAIKSGILAAEGIWEVLHSEVELRTSCTASKYPRLFDSSWLYKELKAVRNYRPAFKWGLLPALMYCALEDYLLKGRGFWTLRQQGWDYQMLLPKKRVKPIEYGKPDGVLSFDRASSVFFSGVHHTEDRPCHLKLIDSALAIKVNHDIYASPETRYCPAGVYQIFEESGLTYLKINSTNCLHCKACDIKDPTQNIVWTPPEGGNGPNYVSM
ncbi:MAG: electron transfer flavoprotein-ubiquinone oxidoreductase [Neisseriaceae bacterium]